MGNLLLISKQFICLTNLWFKVANLRESITHCIVYKYRYGWGNYLNISILNMCLHSTFFLSFVTLRSSYKSSKTTEIATFSIADIANFHEAWPTRIFHIVSLVSMAIPPVAFLQCCLLPLC